MKRLISLWLTLLLVLLPLLLSSCERIPPAQTEEEQILDRWLNGNYSPPSVYDACVRFGYPYSVFEKYCGKNEIRHYVIGDTEHWYTVLPGEDNDLFYLFLTPDGNGDYLFDEFGFSHVDIRTNPEKLREWVREEDFPSAFFGDALPAHCKLDFYTAEEIEQNIETEWEIYQHYCSAAGLDRFPEEFYNDEYRFYHRCVQFVMFDLIEGNNATSGLYNYDIFRRKDGTGVLIYRHFLYIGSPMFPTLESEHTWELSADDMENWHDLLNDVDFDNIPTWNPEEALCVDGETTYFYGSGEGHLIAMWSADWERYGIYRIRTALEAMVQQRLADESGAV